MAELEHLGGKRAESARVRRAEQLRRWRGSQTEQEPAERQPRSRRGAPRVRFEDGAVFLAACSSGDTDEVQRLLARGADINTANVDGLTALHQVTGAGPAAQPPRRPAAAAGGGSPPPPAGWGVPRPLGRHGYGDRVPESRRRRSPGRSAPVPAAPGPSVSPAGSLSGDWPLRARRG